MKDLEKIYINILCKLCDEKGATMIEYALVAFGIAVAAVAAVGALGQLVNGLFGSAVAAFL